MTDERTTMTTDEYTQAFTQARADASGCVVPITVVRGKSGDELAPGVVHFDPNQHRADQLASQSDVTPVVGRKWTKDADGEFVEVPGA